jgi:peptidoglycan LD-endopeptidase LytH
VTWRILLFAAVAAVPGYSQRLELVWPTPNTAWAEGKPPSAWLQHAGSGDPASGGFGGVRSGGSQFHEGIDIKPVARSRSGDPLDSVFAAMAGVVRHVNAVAGKSSYGRYVVMEHAGKAPAVYTLYAHLARIAPEVRVGGALPAGAVLGTMGNSAGGYVIPKSRAHLHFEIGLVLTSDFQAWYDRQRFGSRNEHGMWNGINLSGMDPLDFFDAWRSRRIGSVQDYFDQLEPAVRLRIATFRIPDFIRRYPTLLTEPMPIGPVAGWEIRFTWTGIPFAWTPLTAADIAGLPREQPRIIEVNAALQRQQRSKSLAVDRRGAWSPARDLEIVLELLFGIRL